MLVSAASSRLAGIRWFIMEVHSRLQCWCAVSRNAVRFSLQQKETGASPMLLLLSNSTPTVPRACAKTESDQLSAQLFFHCYCENAPYRFLLQIALTVVTKGITLIQQYRTLQDQSGSLLSSGNIQTFLPEREPIKMIQFHYYITKYHALKLFDYTTSTIIQSSTIPLQRQ